MTAAYVPPGVTVEELTSPSVTPIIAVPGSICLVGRAAAAPSQTTTELLTLSGTTATPLAQVPAGAANVTLLSVMDYLTPSIAPNGFQATTDYTFNTTTNALTRVVTSQTITATANSGQAAITLASGAVPAVGQIIRLTNAGTTETVIVLSVAGQVVTATTNLQHTYTTSGTAVTWGTIPDGDQVRVTYTYLPSDYWQPVRLTNMADIQDRFGTALNAAGTQINSHLSFAAQCAFENGASSLVLQPFFTLTAGVPTAPVDADLAVAGNWTTVLSNLLGLESIDIIVPVIGQGDVGSYSDSTQVGILQVFQDFLYTQLSINEQYMIALFGEDQTRSTTQSPEGQESTLQTHATTLAARYNSAVTQQIVFVNTSLFSRQGNNGNTYNVGGQFMAASIAGMLAARIPSATVTRAPVSGYTNVADNRTKAQKDSDASLGMLVVEAKGNVVQVRHGITMDASTVATRELNVVRSKHFIINSLRNTLDTQVIGKIVADSNAPTLVNSLVIATLEQLRGGKALISYGNVSSRITSLDPTAMEVRFSFQPVFYVNYITVVFSIDLTQNNITVSVSDTAT